MSEMSERETGAQETGAVTCGCGWWKFYPLPDIGKWLSRGSARDAVAHAFCWRCNTACTTDADGKPVVTPMAPLQQSPALAAAEWLAGQVETMVKKTLFGGYNICRCCPANETCGATPHETCAAELLAAALAATGTATDTQEPTADAMALYMAGEQLAFWCGNPDLRSWTCVDWANYYRDKARNHEDPQLRDVSAIVKRLIAQAGGADRG